MFSIFRKWFPATAAFVLTIAGLAKIITVFGRVRILEVSDPLFGISFRALLVAVGLVEIIIAVLCLLTKGSRLSTLLVAWLATCFLIYRVGLRYVGWHRPCPCFGNITDFLGIPPQTADTVMRIVLAYLLIGSYGTLFWLWRQKRKSTLSSEPGETAVSTA